MAEPLRISELESHLPEPPAMIRPPVPAPSRNAYRLLHVGFSALPLLAGADKFSNSLCDWPRYLAPQIPKLTGISAQNFMYGVGVVEIAAGLGVAVKPKLFSYVVAGWLGGIIGNLVLGRKNYDVALRDFGLLLGAISLGQLSRTQP